MWDTADAGMRKYFDTVTKYYTFTNCLYSFLDGLDDCLSKRALGKKKEITKVRSSWMFVGTDCQRHQKSRKLAEVSK